MEVFVSAGIDSLVACGVCGGGGGSGGYGYWFLRQVVSGWPGALHHASLAHL